MADTIPAVSPCDSSSNPPAFIWKIEEGKHIKYKAKNKSGKQ